MNRIYLGVSVLLFIFVGIVSGQLFPLEKGDFGVATHLDYGSEMPNGWKDCGSSSDIFQLKLMTIAPDPPKRARKLKVRVVGNLLETLNGGKMNYTVHFGIIPIVQDSMELCDALKMEPKLPQCPLKRGQWDVTHEAELPAEVPFGRYTISAAGWDKDGKPIFCVKGTTMIGIMGLLDQPIDSGVEGGSEMEGDRQVVFH